MLERFSLLRTNADAVLIKNCLDVCTISLKPSAQESAINQSQNYAAVLTLPYSAVLVT